jgi:tetratricopeptide (TPR) repeat protein
MPKLFFLFIISYKLHAQVADTLLPYLLEIENDSNRINQLYQRGYELRHVDPQKAFQYGKICEEQAMAIHSKKLTAKAYNLLGVLYYLKGDYKTAANYHLQALELRKKIGDVLGTANSLTNMGNIYVDMKMFALAEDCHLKALEIYNQLKDKKRLANCLINLGALNQHMNKQTTANEYYLLANKIGEDLNDYEIRSICLNNMAIVYYSQKNYEKSIAMNNDALELRNFMDNNVEVVDSYLNLASNYMALNDYRQAKVLLDTAFVLCKDFEYFEAEQEANKLFAQYFAGINQFKQAFAWLEKYNRVKDSIMNNEKVLVDFEYNKNLNTVSKSKSQFVSNLWLLVLICAALIFIPFTFIKYKR